MSRTLKYKSHFYTIFEKVKEQMTLDSFKKTMLERFWKIEGIISEAKQIHKLKRAQFRGRQKVQIQAYFTASVQNIKRLVKSLDAFDDNLNPVTTHIMTFMNVLSSSIRYLSSFKLQEIAKLKQFSDYLKDYDRIVDVTGMKKETYDLYKDVTPNTSHAWVVLSGPSSRLIT